MRVNFVFLVSLVLLAVAPARSESEEKPTADGEVLQGAESKNSNNTTDASIESEGISKETKSNSKRTIDHNLGYGYRFNTVLRPVPSGHGHSMMRPRPPISSSNNHYYHQPQYKHHYRFQSSPSAPQYIRYSQPLPSAHQETRPVTESPSNQRDHEYHTIPSSSMESPAPQTFSLEDDSSKSEAPNLGHHQYSPMASTYQQVLQSAMEPTYILTQTTATGASLPSHQSPLTLSPTASQAAIPATASLAALTHAGTGATHMIPVIILRVMDSHTAASTLNPYTAAIAHAPIPYPLINLQYLRDYMGKMYTSQPTMQFVTPGETDTVMYVTDAERPNALYRSTQVQKLQLQHQLHAQLQQQMQQQNLAIAALREQHRQRVAAHKARTEVTVHHSTAMSPQDYKESVEQQDDS